MESSEKVNLKLVPGYLNDELVVKLNFKYNWDLITAIKSIPGRRWNKENRYWYFHHSRFDLAKLIDALELFAEIDYSALQAFDDGVYEEPLIDDIIRAGTKSPAKPATVSNPDSSIELPKGYLEKLVQKRYSSNTIKTYSTYIKAFIN